MSLMHREQMDCCNYFEATGNEITIDSKSNWMQLESIEGNTTQVNTTGAQLLDLSAINKSVAGAVVNYADGGYSISGIGALTASFIASYDLDIKKILKPGNLILKSELTVPKLYIRVWNGSTMLMEFQRNSTRQITQEIIDNENIRFECFLYSTAGNTITPGTYYPMLYQDGDGTWEPYTGGKPSPSPEYPQEIVNADIKSIMIKSAQMFDINNPSSTLGQWIIAGNKISITNPTSSYLGLNYNIDVTPNTLYTFYSIIFNDTPNVESMHVSISLLREDGTITKNNVIILNNTSSGKFTTTEDTKSIDIYFRNRTTGNGGYFKDIVLNKGSSVIPWQPYYNPQTISLTLTKPLYGIDNYNDEIAVTKRIDKCIEFTFNGSENWAVISKYEGFYYGGILPFTAMRRAGFCNQFPVDTKGEAIESIRIGNGNSVLFCVYSRFYDDTAADKGLAAWKAHLSTNPLKIVTYTNPEGYVETPLEQSNIDAIKSLYVYDGVTLLNNNENTVMKVMYKSK